MKKKYFHEIIFSRLALGIFVILIFIVIGITKQSSIINLSLVPQGPRVVLPNGKVVLTEIADTAEKRSKGLSGREALAKDTSMLFVFDREDYYNFWMPDMNFSIDIVWLDDDYKVVDIIEKVEPMPEKSLSELPRYTSSIPAKYVIEFNAGFCSKYNLVKGDQIELFS